MDGLSNMVLHNDVIAAARCVRKKVIWKKSSFHFLNQKCPRSKYVGQSFWANILKTTIRGLFSDSENKIAKKSPKNP